MDIFNLFTLCGGLAFFLYGMNVMSTGLEKMAGGKLEKILRKVTSNKFMGLLLGAGITIAIQSSSAMTVMLVGLVNSGIMKLGQTIGVIMGSNIGTTLTAWLLSLTGIESSNGIIKMLKPESFSPIVALVGIILIMLCKSGKKKDLGGILVGFSVLMYGMTLMGSAVKPLADVPEFASVLTAFNNPFFGVLIGTVVTGIIQSSAASVGMLQALSITGSISYGMAIPIIMGQNIGTCVTSLISSIGTNRNAKRVAVVHIFFNLIGTVLCLIVFYILHAIFNFAIVDSQISPVGIAIVHSIFNVITTIILFPFDKLLEKIAVLIVRDKNNAETYSFLDERLLLSPAFAIAECKNMTVKMAQLSKEILIDSIDMINNFSSKKAQKLAEKEELIDDYEDKLGTFLVKLSSKELTDKDSREISKLLHCIGDFERISDHAINILDAANEIHDKKIKFSEEAETELKVLTNAIVDILALTVNAFEKDDLAAAFKVEPLEQVIDGLKEELKSRHIERLQAGQCTIELGFIFSDILTNYERVSDHCSNIAVCIIRIENSDMDTHVYLKEVKTSGDSEFVSEYENFHQKYALPK